MLLSKIMCITCHNRSKKQQTAPWYYLANWQRGSAPPAGAVLGCGGVGAALRTEVGGISYSEDLELEVWLFSGWSRGPLENWGWRVWAGSGWAGVSFGAALEGSGIAL